MTFAADPRLLRGRGLEADFSVAIQADDGTWLELNSPAPQVAGDYWGALLRAPNVTMRTQDDLGIAVTSVSDLLMDNAPWRDTRAGFWDSVLPITLRGKTVSSWYRRKIRLAFNIADESGEGYSEAMPLGVYRIDDKKTGSGQATIKLISLDRAWDEVSAESVLDGTEPFRGSTISALIKRLIKAADPGADVSGIPDSLEMPLAEIALASNLGPCPNVVTDSGERSVNHWIPRCARLDLFASPQTVYVGFEVPGMNQKSDGAIAKFDVATVRWTVVVWPSQLEEIVPCLLYPGDASTLYFWTYADLLATSAPLGYVNQYSVPKAGGTVSAIGSGKPGWMARFIIRNGCVPGPAAETLLGTPWNYRDPDRWFGEPMMLPFLQMIESLGNNIWSPSLFHWNYTEVAWNGYGKDGDPESPRWSMGLYELVGPGNVSLVLDYVESPAKPLFRYFAAWTWHQPQTRAVGAALVAFWVGQGESTDFWKWRIYQQEVGSATQIAWTLDGLGDAANQFFTRHITAWRLYTWDGSTVTMLVATLHWNEVEDATGPPWGECALYECVVSGAGGGAATCDKVWSISPAYTDSDVPMIVRLWSAYERDYTFGHRPKWWAVAVIVNRSTAAGPMYGLGVWRHTDGWIERFLSSDVGYTGPTSGAPFDGFVQDPSDDNVFHFIDQATGQAWRCSVNEDDLDLSWAIENDGFPVTASEFALASPDGLSLIYGDEPEIYWWTAPGPHGDTLVGEYDNLPSSAVLYRPGEYAMVRLGRRLSQCVDVADFSGMSVWKAILKLLARAFLYDRYLDGNGRLVLERIDATPSGPTIVFEELVGPAVLQAGEIPAAGLPTKSERYKSSANTVEIIPWGLQRKAVPDPTRITGTGSKFAGTFLAQINTPSAVSLSVICVAGGDINDMVSDPTEIQSMKQAALLFAWKQLLPEAHGHLVTVCAAMDTEINVGGLVGRANRVWCGSVEVRVGDRLKVGSGNWITIDSLAAGGVSGNYITITLHEAVGTSAGAWTDVTFEPSLQSSMSNGELGIATAPSGLGSGATSLAVDDSRAIRRWMVLQACFPGLPSEYLYVDRLEQGGGVHLVRGMFGTAVQTWPAGTVLKGLVWTRQQGKLYEVGDTGVMVGVTMSRDPSLEVDPGSNIDLGDKASRSVCPGDGVIIRADGAKLAKLVTGVVKSIDQAALGRDQNQVKSRKVDDNPFIDPVFAHGYAPALLAVLAPILTTLSGVDVPLTPAIGPGTRVRIDDRSLFPGAVGPVGFRPTQIQYDLTQKRMKVDLLSLSEIAGGSAPSWLTLLWARSFRAPCYLTWEITDLDPTDGRQDIVGVLLDNTLCILDPHTGAMRYTVNPGTTGATASYVCCADVNGDGRKEIIWGSHDGYVRCMSADLTVTLWTVRDWFAREGETPPLDRDRWWSAGPTPAVVDGDVVLYSVGYDGRVIAIRGSDGAVLHTFDTNEAIGGGEEEDAEMLRGLTSRRADLTGLLTYTGAPHIVITGDSLSFNAYGWGAAGPAPGGNAWENSPGMMSWPFIVRDATWASDPYFVHGDVAPLMPNATAVVARNTSPTAFVFPMNNRYAWIAGDSDGIVSIDAYEAFPSANYTYLVLYFAKHAGADAAGNVDVYIDGSFYTTVNLHGDDGMWMGHEVFTVIVPRGVISFRNWKDTDGNPAATALGGFLIGIGHTTAQFYFTGHGGYTSGDLLAEVGTRVTDHAPDVMFLMLGANDIALGVDPSAFLDNILAIVEAAREVKPYCEIVLISTPPMSTQGLETRTAMSSHGYAVASYLDGMRAIAEQQSCFYLDLFDLLGPMNRALWRHDYIHLSPEGNRIVFDALQQLVFPGLPKARTFSEDYMVQLVQYKAGPERLAGYTAVLTHDGTIWNISQNGSVLTSATEGPDGQYHLVLKFSANHTVTNVEHHNTSARWFAIRTKDVMINSSQMGTEELFLLDLLSSPPTLATRAMLSGEQFIVRFGRRY